MLRFHVQKFISYNSIFESILFAKYSYHRQSNQFRAEFIESDGENSITYPNKSGIKKKNNNNKIKLKKKNLQYPSTTKLLSYEFELN